jgi:hypothetical protein
MDLDDVARAAAGIDGVRERRQGGRRGWYLDSRLVAREDDPETLLVRCGFGARERLVDRSPEVFSVTPRLEAHTKVLVDLTRVSPAVLAELLAGAAELQRDAAP